jgi:hypothetical protein
MKGIVVDLDCDRSALKGGVKCGFVTHVMPDGSTWPNDPSSATRRKGGVD